MTLAVFSTCALMGQEVNSQTSFPSEFSVLQNTLKSAQSCWLMDVKFLLVVKLIVTWALEPLLTMQGGLQQLGTITLVMFMTSDPGRRRMFLCNKAAID